jgi:hypothetical protein
MSAEMASSAAQVRGNDVGMFNRKASIASEREM